MPLYLSQVDYAKHRGISQPRVSKMISQGKLEGCIRKISGKKMIDRDKADIKLKETLDRIYNRPKDPPKPNEKPDETEKKQTSKSAGTSGMNINQSQTIQAQYKAALLKLEYEEKSGKLVNAEQVETDFFGIGRMVRDAILNVPSRIGAELASINDVHIVSEKLTAELTAALEELSR